MPERASSSRCRLNRPRCSISISRLRPRPERVAHHDRQGPRIITVTGAAGGVGCTTLAVNLATTLAAAKEHETILLDLDLLFGSVDACLDITAGPHLDPCGSELRAARPDPAQAIDRSPRLRALRLASPRSRCRRPPPSIPKP